MHEKGGDYEVRSNFLDSFLLALLTTYPGCYGEFRLVLGAWSCVRLQMIGCSGAISSYKRAITRQSSTVKNLSRKTAEVPRLEVTEVSKWHSLSGR